MHSALWNFVCATPWKSEPKITVKKMEQSVFQHLTINEFGGGGWRSQVHIWDFLFQSVLAQWHASTRNTCPSQTVMSQPWSVERFRKWEPPCSSSTSIFQQFRGTLFRRRASVAEEKKGYCRVSSHCRSCCIFLQVQCLTNTYLKNKMRSAFK